MSILQSDGINGFVVSDNCFNKKREKIIIDTDPGIDDSMAIIMAFQSPDLDILGLTTIFGNVTTEDATRNALILCEIAGRSDIPVAEGSLQPFKRGPPRIADFVHGSNGLGDISVPPPKSKKSEKSASEFLVDKVSEYPGEVSILALGPLTNLALAIKRDSTFASKVKRIVVLGGAFFALGNVNPAAEANIYGDPEAADIVFTCGANIDVVGINITTQVKMTGIFLHDPVSFVALVRPDLFTFKKGVVRVETQGICVGHTLMDQGLKKWNSSNPWSGYSPVSVAWAVNTEELIGTTMKNIATMPTAPWFECLPIYDEKNIALISARINGIHRVTGKKPSDDAIEKMVSENGLVGFLRRRARFWRRIGVYVSGATKELDQVSLLKKCRTSDLKLAAKVFDVLSPLFYALYFVVGGFLGPYFVYRMFAFYLSGADDTVIPRWVWVGFHGFSWL
ncbi:uridine nucleosidase 1 [Phtheirospermum japonicum]|uniref:Uridine nucleosidase 1 n=1 Tax=Phtheirospermum japonicum TaxID=374723 RepID=A0A830CIN4_9LAMI|nr:uridine nucleosidase 1 [Phtheirospermum japonicum]